MTLVADIENVNAENQRLKQLLEEKDITTLSKNLQTSNINISNQSEAIQTSETSKINEPVKIVNVEPIKLSITLDNIKEDDDGNLESEVLLLKA